LMVRAHPGPQENCSKEDVVAPFSKKVDFPLIDPRLRLSVAK
jgi:hypothetical protein